MRSFIAVLVAVAAGPLSVGACSSGDDSAPASNGLCHGDYAALTQTQLDAEAASSGKCIGASDLAIECANDVTTLAEQVGADCYAHNAPDDDTQDACVSKALPSQTNPTLSDGCLDCYIKDIGCARDNCLVVCGSAPASDLCYTCRVKYGCVDSFYSCSGLPNPRATSGGAGNGAGGDSGAGGSASETPSAGAGGS